MSTDPLDELYAAPLDDFVATRNALAARLQGSGKADVAKGVRRVAKPKATVWALNKLARDGDAKLLKGFLVAFDALKRAQLRRPDDVAAAMKHLRDATEAVIHRATDAIAKAGVRVSVDTHRRIGTTLRGAAASARDELLAGTLTHEITAPGFEVFGGATPVGRRQLRAVSPGSVAASATQRERDDLMRRRVQQLAEESASKAREAERAASEALAARQRLKELEARARSARQAATTSQRTAERARRRTPSRARG